MGISYDFMNATGQQQHQKRRALEPIDQHGRKWGTIVDITNGSPCSTISPQFNAPYIPDQKYLSLKGWDSLAIDYDAALSNAIDAHKTYQRLLINTAASMHPEDMGGSLLKDAGDGSGRVYTTNPALLQMVGQPPKPIDFIRAARAGNLWVLGLSDVVPNWAKPLVGAAVEEKDLYPDADEEAEKYDAPRAKSKKVAA